VNHHSTRSSPCRSFFLVSLHPPPPPAPVQFLDLSSQKRRDMPHSTTSGSAMRAPSTNRASTLKASLADSANTQPPSQLLEKFPDHPDSHFGLPNGTRSPSPRKPNGHVNGNGSADRWQPRRENGQLNGAAWTRQSRAQGHTRHQSLSETLQRFRNRHGSISQNAHEIADALKAPVSPKLIVCHPDSPLPQGEAKMLTLTMTRFFVFCGTHHRR
jgi:hypothetical protein